MRIAITGATGLLGRNLLFEIIKQKFDNLENIELLILGRSHPTTSLHDRILDILIYDGLDYLDIEQNQRKKALAKINAAITPIPFDLAQDNLGISNEYLPHLKTKPIDHFFHVAALTDFRSDNTTKAKLEEVNVRGTQRILNLINNLCVDQLVYVGSAYSCGSKTGLVKPDYVNLKEVFRNPYEETKLRAEVLMREFSRKKNIKIKVFRPSTIAGRLIEKPIGRINKFDVFYGWAAFFLRYKLKQIKNISNLYSESCEIPIRLRFNPQGGLNIIPADYAAKVMYGISMEDGQFDSYHLANNVQTPNQLYGDTTFEALKITGYQYVAEEPKDKNKIEEMYYRTVGKIFTPYGISDEIIFDVSNLTEFTKKSGLICPVINRENYLKLLKYAMDNYFGILKEI